MDPAREIVECVPNFSEGRRREVVDAIAAAATAAGAVKVLDLELDANHHRCVLTFAGAIPEVEKAAFAAVAAALPYAHARGRWGAAVLGGAMLAVTVLAVPSAPAVPLAAAAWLTAAAVALRARRA